jgi:hypothetical protein
MFLSLQPSYPSSLQNYFLWYCVGLESVLWRLTGIFGTSILACLFRCRVNRVPQSLIRPIDRAIWGLKARRAPITVPQPQRARRPTHTRYVERSVAHTHTHTHILTVWYCSFLGKANLSLRYVLYSTVHWRIIAASSFTSNHKLCYMFSYDVLNLLQSWLYNSLMKNVAVQKLVYWPSVQWWKRRFMCFMASSCSSAKHVKPLLSNFKS